jgi:hypothetical protein
MFVMLMHLLYLIEGSKAMAILDLGEDLPVVMIASTVSRMTTCTTSRATVVTSEMVDWWHRDLGDERRYTR